MSNSNLVQIAYKKESVLGTTPSAVAALATLSLAEDVILASVQKGGNRNTKTFELVVNAAAANPTDTILADITGTADAIVLTVTPNDGTNNGSVAVDLTSEELAELINSGAVVGKSVTLTDTGSLRDLQTASGGDSVALTSSDDQSVSFSGGSGNFNTARFTSEQYSGTPELTESAQIRNDRMSSGQVVTGLTVGGGHNFELAKEKAIEDFIESAMFNTWVSTAAVVTSLEINIVTKKIIRTLGSFVTEGIIVGDFIKLAGFSSDGNNVVVMVTSVSALELTYAGPEGMSSESGGTSYQLCDKITIGTTKKSLTIQKSFLDLIEKSLIYRGCLVSQFDLTVEYGSLITGVFQVMGTDYEEVDEEEDKATYNTDIDPQDTTETMNGSVDMPITATTVTGTWEQDTFCIQSLGLSMNNNLTVQNCIGRAAPEDYSPGTAQITVDLSSYLKDSNWPLLRRKISQEPFSLGFMVQNIGGWYGFHIPALQVSFDDPQSGGANQDISMEMSGVAKVGANGESSLTIYREPTT